MAIGLEPGVPILRIFDVDRAREFYVDWLGCRVDWEHRFADDAPLYMQVSREGLVLHLSEHSGDGTPGSVVYVAARGVAELHRELQAKPYRYLNPGLGTGPVGGDCMELLDPFGNTLRIEERVEPGTPVAAAPATAAPVETEPTVHELRVVVTAPDYDDALRLYRDVLGLPERMAVTSPGGRVAILDAGRATLEIADPPHAAYIDEIEVGRRVAGPIRIAFGVADSASLTPVLVAAGASLVAPPVSTPWGSLNSRLDGPAGLQLTLFSGEE
jgi:catechol 2,3-dioxygenase-like lactoylglutathione lyase family enzyme